MSRKTGGADSRLMKAALDMLPHTGLSGLSVRGVAARAGVNLGMFHYHFRTKGEFDRRVMSDFYEKFFSGFMGAVESAGGESPLERLRRGVLTAARFVREHRPFLVAFGKDLLADNREAISFARRNFPRHVVVLMKLIGECRRAGQIRRMPVIQVLPFIFGAVMAPIIAVSLLEKLLPLGVRGLPLAMLRRMVSSDRMLEERLDLALSALGPRAGKSR